VAVSIVVGGQFGSEGKGKLVSHLACADAGPTAVVRSGGSNAGHTAEGSRGRFLLRQLPSGVVADGCMLYLAAGMQLDLDVLFAEIQATEVEAERLRIDLNAVVIADEDRLGEDRAQLGDRIGSTLSGTGFSLAQKVMRARGVRRAEDVPALAPYLADVALEINRHVDAGGHLIVEGTQGFGLSLHHGAYPFVTGRDTTAAGFLSECGLAPALVTDVIVVLRTFPIRVGGNSGPLHDEVSWETVRARSGYPSALAEYTTVTGRLRRVGEFDWELAERAVLVNRPTSLALHGADYLCHGDLGCRRWSDLSSRTKAFVAELESRLGTCVRFVFTGPDGSDLIDRSPTDDRTHRRAPRAGAASRGGL
jgi:adenylosuccinate synthase